jgi:hypothetical protein
MFKRLVMLVRGLMGCQSTAPSSLTVEQPSLSAKPLRAKRTQTSPQPVRNPRQPANKSPTRKLKAAQPTTAVKSRKPASKPAQTTSGKRGRPRKTPA